MDTTTIVGLCAATLTTVAFLPQTLKVIKTRQTRDISLIMYIIFSLGVILWLTYGILREDLPIILANIVTLSLTLIILYYKIRYK